MASTQPFKVKNLLQCNRIPDSPQVLHGIPIKIKKGGGGGFSSVCLAVRLTSCKFVLCTV